MSQSKPLIVIDGVAGAGKTTVTAALARALGLDQLYCSNVFRTLAHTHLQHGDLERSHEEARALDASLMFMPLTNPALRTEEVAKAAGKMAGDPVIRQVFVTLARQAYAELPANSRGLIAEGRSLGNQVFAQPPHEAGLKIYMTADLAVRAQRAQSGQGQNVSAAMAARDQNDMQRENFRLVAAPDAVIVDTTQLSAEQTFECLRDMAIARYPALRAAI